MTIFCLSAARSNKRFVGGRRCVVLVVRLVGGWLGADVGHCFSPCVIVRCFFWLFCTRAPHGSDGTPRMNLLPPCSPSGNQVGKEAALTLPKAKQLEEEDPG